jgi:hypothetical protein
MRKLKLIRFNHSEDDTQGLLFWDHPGQPLDFLCFTLEDEHRDVKVKHETRIPEGLYKLKLRKWGGLHTRYLERYGQQWHKGMIQILDVPGFTDILIHCGNTDEHTSGCILVGDSLSPGFLGSSRDAYGKVYPEVRDELLQGQEVVLEVISM